MCTHVHVHVQCLHHYSTYMYSVLPIQMLKQKIVYKVKNTTLTSIDDEHITKVLLGRRIVTSKVQNTVTNTHSAVATTTFDPITCDILLLPLRSICMDNEREGEQS